LRFERAANVSATEYCKDTDLADFGVEVHADARTE
jgi:hypothetical protein